MAGSLQHTTELVLDFFYASTQRDKIRLEIEYVDDIYSRRLELANNEKDKDAIVKSKPFTEGLNGTMVMPSTKDGIHYILISKAILNETYYIGTIIHELTHIHDYIDFSAEFCDGNYESIWEHASSGFFYYWSEFHARRNGYSYSRKILNCEDDIDFILNTEIELQNDYLLKNLRTHRYSDAVNYVYFVVQYMGRFSIWEDMYPDKITAHTHLPDYLQNAYGPKLIELYDTLHSMVNFDIAIAKLEEIEGLIRSTFKDYQSKSI